MGQFSNSFPKHFSYLCEYAFRFDLSCSFCEYPFIFHCLHCSPSCFDPDSLLLAHLWLGLSWIDYISANKRFSSSKTSSRQPYTSSKQQERQKHSAETTINFSGRYEAGHHHLRSRGARYAPYHQEYPGLQPMHPRVLDVGEEDPKEEWGNYSTLAASAVARCASVGMCSNRSITLPMCSRRFSRTAPALRFPLIGNPCLAV